jgi:hypothetical protein
MRKSFRHTAKVLRAWLYPAQSMQNWQGWVAMVYPLAIAVLPYGIGAAIQHSLKPGPWSVSLVLVAFLGLALIAIWRLLPYHEPEVSFSIDGHGLTVTVRKSGRSLKDVAILLEVPKSFDHLRRIGHGDDLKWPSTEGDRLVWDEHDLDIQGGGIHPTVWRFQILPPPPGEHHIRLVISHDDLPHAVEVERTVSTGRSGQWAARMKNNATNRENYVKGRLDRLLRDQKAISAAMRAGHFTPSVLDSMQHREGNNQPMQISARFGHMTEDHLDADEAAAINAGLAEGHRIWSHYNRLKNAERMATQRRQQQENIAAKKEGRQAVQLQQGGPVLLLTSDDHIERAYSTIAHAAEVAERVLTRLRSTDPEQQGLER